MRAEYSVPAGSVFIRGKLCYCPGNARYFDFNN